MTVTRAMIMGAGLGSRMRPLTDHRPKPLVMVAGQALIDHSIDRLVDAGVTKIIVNVHYKADMLRAHLQTRHDVEIAISDETEVLLDTGGGVVKALPHFGGEPFFIVNSDSIWVEGETPALPAMQAQWDASRMDGLLLLADMETALGYEGDGDFALDAAARIDRARESDLQPWAYPGIQIVHPQMFDGAPQGAFSTNIMWDRAIATRRLSGTVLDGVWLHVGTPEARDEADHYLRAIAHT